MALGLTAALTIALAGCVSIPTSGPVQVGGEAPDDTGFVFPIASGPEFDASPEEIVAGFLTASEAGTYNNDFEVARQFLTATAENGWKPDAARIVYRGVAETSEPDAAGQLVVSVAEIGWMDDAGRFTESSGEARQVLFEVAKNATGQWRIAALDDGVLVSGVGFLDAYAPVRVYFATPDLRDLVPDERWCAVFRLAQCAVSALVDGPSPWLREGVVSGLPEGLAPPEVTISDDGLVTIDLAGGASQSGSNRELLEQQLRATFTWLRGTAVAGFDVTVLRVPWETSGTLELARDVSPDVGPFVLAGEQLAVVEGRGVTPVADAAPLTGLDPQSPAVSLDLSIRVVLAGGRQLLLLPEGGGEPEPLLTQEALDLVPPTVDPYGWVWTGERASAGTLLAVQPGEEPIEVEARWLEGRQIRSMRVSRDGSRIAVVSVGPDLLSDVEVAAVVRGEGGRPSRLSEDRLTVGASLRDVTEVAWVDEVTLAVLGKGGSVDVPSVHEVVVGGTSAPLASQLDIAGIAAARDRLYLVGEDDVLRMLRGTTWTDVAEGVRFPAFPG
jgi:hypothetical protein